MADPKYADLPGIAYDQPDVYETSELPEADQYGIDVADESDNIEKISLSASEAYKTFQAAKLDSSRADFSDRLSRARKIGYDVLSGDYEMAGSDMVPETPQQKYQRLQHEMRELMEEVNNIKESEKADQKAEWSSAPVTVQQVQQLQKQLNELRLEQVLGSDTIADLSDPHGSLQKKLISQLDVFKQGSEGSAGKTTPGSKGKPATTTTSGDQIVYELYYKPEMAKFQQSKQAAEIGHRLEKLEAIVGNDPEKLSVLSSATNQRGLLESVSILTSKLTLLDSTQLDQVEGRLQALSVRLNQISEKKQGLEEADKNSKVSELYELLKKTDALCASLPQVADRLVILKELHEQALQFTKALTQLDTTQQQITTTLADNQKALKEIQGGFSKNMDVIKGNIAGIDSRLNVLKK